MGKPRKRARAARDLLYAVDHPVRREVLTKVLGQDADSPLTPRAIADSLDRPLSNISYHVRVLAECGALENAGTRQVRGAVEHFYLASPKVERAPWVMEVLRSYDEGTATA